jgi:hypothetical protein
MQNPEAAPGEADGKSTGENIENAGFKFTENL